MTAGPALTEDQGLSRDCPVPFPVDVPLTLSVHRHGGGDPTHATDAAGGVWRTKKLSCVRNFWDWQEGFFSETR